MKFVRFFITTLMLFSISSCNNNFNYKNISPYKDYEIVYFDEERFTNQQEKKLFAILDSLNYQKEKIDFNYDNIDYLGEIIIHANRHLKEDENNESSLIISYKINFYSGIILRSNALISSTTSDEYAKLNENDLNNLKSIFNLNATKYTLTILGDTDNIIEPLKTTYQFGEEVNIKLSPSYDVDTYIYLDNNKITQYHNDSDYWGYKFKMPAKNVTIYITHNPFYVDRIYAFYEVFNWAKDLKLNEIEKVSLEKGYLGVDSNIVPTITYSTDSEDINEVYLLTKAALRKKDLESIDGGYYIKYTLFTAKNNYEITFQNNFLYYTTFNGYYTFTYQNADIVLPQLDD